MWARHTVRVRLAALSRTCAFSSSRRITLIKRPVMLATRLLCRMRMSKRDGHRLFRLLAIKRMQWVRRRAQYGISHGFTLWVTKRDSFTYSFERVETYGTVVPL